MTNPGYESVVQSGNDIYDTYTEPTETTANSSEE
jgi:hypothetical protein